MFKFYANKTRTGPPTRILSSTVSRERRFFAAILKIDAAALRTPLIIDFKESFASSQILVVDWAKGSRDRECLEKMFEGTQPPPFFSLFLSLYALVTRNEFFKPL